jgi:hypothetical protein
MLLYLHPADLEWSQILFLLFIVVFSPLAFISLLFFFFREIIKWRKKQGTEKNEKDV